MLPEKKEHTEGNKEKHKWDAGKENSTQTPDPKKMEAGKQPFLSRAISEFCGDTVYPPPTAAGTGTRGGSSPKLQVCRETGAMRVSPFLFLVVLVLTLGGVLLRFHVTSPTTTVSLQRARRRVLPSNMASVKALEHDSSPSDFSHLVHSESSETITVRRLGVDNVLPRPTIIPLDRAYQNSNQRRHAYRYIFGQLQRYTSDVIVYPYPFTVVDEVINEDTGEPEEVSYEFSRGAIIDTVPYRRGGWKSIETHSDVHFGQSKVLYDFNIGVLKIQVPYKDQITELLYESDRYCEILVTFLGHYGKECLSSDAYELLEDKLSPKLVYVDHNHLNLLESEEDKFGILIIPDTILGAEDVIAEKIGSAGAKYIRDFVSRGGLLYVSGKAGLVLEKIDLMTKGAFQDDRILVSETNEAFVEGCDAAADKSPLSPNYVDFVAQMLCFSVTEETRQTYFLSTYLLNQQVVASSGYSPLVFFDPEGLEKKDANTGFTMELSARDKQFLPMYLHKLYGKGQIVINQGAPAHHTDTVHWFFNSLFLALGKSLYSDARVKLDNQPVEEDGGQPPIPGNEDGVILTIDLAYHNLFRFPLNDFGVQFWVPPLVEVKNIYITGSSGSCVLQESPMLPPPETDQPLAETGYVCSFGSIDGLSKLTVGVRMEILDASVTRRRYGIQMLYTKVNYVNSRINKRYDFDSGGFYINALVAALLRPSINPDPSSFYPIPGRGVYVDNVLPCQNVEHTAAYEVEYVAMLPLVTPAVDGDDQGKLISLVEFWDEYYKGATNGIGDYVYPFEATNDFDYIDYNFLSGKDAILNADWDTGVKQSKVVLDTSKVNVPVNTKLANYTSTNTNSYVVTRQLHFTDSKKYYEHATQRQLVFVDTEKENGAVSKYLGSIPPERKKPGLNVAKTQFIWVRADIYFYQSYDQYTHPKGLELNDVVSMDKYKDTYDGDCNGMTAEILVPGHFDYRQYPPAGLVPNEYSNELLNNCQGPMYNMTYRRKIDLDEVDVISGGEITKTHYLVPVSDPAIRRPGDIMNFVEDSLEYGYLDSYNDVKYIYAHELTFTLSPDITRAGGLLETILPSGYDFAVNPITNQLITYTADHIAVYETVYEAASGPHGAKLTTKFKRGNMPNERYGKDSGIRMNLEKVTVPVGVDPSNFSVVMHVQELKYDISLPDEDFETYNHVEDKDLLAIKKAFFSLPALKMKMHLQRGDQDDQTILPYELLEPMSRYGFYFQELEKHRTVWGIAESHHVRDPGLTARNGGFSVISQVGISSIPFLEYLQAGSGQLIPSAPETSRVDWKDLWGRQFQQPIRSVFPDVPPIPPPLRNFMMSTTFEITRPEDGKRYLEWPSDEVVDVTLKIKLLNNYPKHFDLTTCQANEAYGYCNEWNPPSRIFGDLQFPKQVTSTPNDSEDFCVNVGHTAFYGSCFGTAGTVISGVELDSVQFTNIAKHCNKDVEPQQCEQDLESIPTIGKATGDIKGKDWIYAPRVESYYPVGYIKDNMWDLTHYDYDDNCFDISYKYHMDNRLPSMDNGVYKPHNIIVQPLYKGFGYLLEWNRSHSVFRHPDLQGWWSDNLQNHDDTLLAGQVCSHDVSVDKPGCLAEDDWIEIRNLRNRSQSTVDRAHRNIYTCLFNRHRIKMHPQQQRKPYPPNVYQNNIIPVKYGLVWNDVSQWDCDLDTPQYQPHNISKYPHNIVKTTSARDWLYFAAALRGGSKETINVVYQLKPFPGLQYEGDTKVNEGGRFVYWNPANGPNSFLIVDNPVNIVKAVRSDMTMDTELFPKSSDPFDVEIYHLIELKDPAEISRRFRDTYYINHYGFGDSLIWTYVGGIEGSRAIVNPGGVTYVRVTFANNAGFDWNLKKGAIHSVEIDSFAWNAYELINQVKHSIQLPTAYNFMTVEIPEELQEYVHVAPSPHCIAIAPLFFDFQSINMATIRDGFKADYFYNVSISPNLPEELRGRVWEFPVTLNTDYFDALPGSPEDPTADGFHDYELKIPPFKIGIPYSNSDEVYYKYRNRVFHYMGQSNEMVHRHFIDPTYDVIGAKYLRANQIATLRDMAAISETSYYELRHWFEDLQDNMTDFVYDRAQGLVTFDLRNDFAEGFPTRRDDLEPPQAEIYVLLKSTASQVPFGTNTLITDASFEYVDNSQKSRVSKMSEPNYRTVNIKGPWLRIQYFVTLGRVSLDDIGEEVWEESDSQIMYPKKRGAMKIMIKTTNVGDGIAYNVRYTLHFDRNIEVVRSLIDDRFEIVVDPVTENCDLTIETDHDLSPGVPDARIYFVKFSPFEELMNRSDFQNFPQERTVVRFMTTKMDLSAMSGQKVGVQVVDQSATFPFLLRDADTVKLKGKLSKKKKTVTLTAEVNQPTINDKLIEFIFQVKNVTTKEWQIIGEVTTASSVVYAFDDILYEQADYSVTTMDPETKAHLAYDDWTYVDVGLILYIVITAVPIVSIIAIFCIIGVVAIVILVVKRKRRLKEQGLADERYHRLQDVPGGTHPPPEEGENEVDMAAMMDQFGEMGKTMFFTEGRPVSVRNWRGREVLVKDSSTASPRSES